MKTLEQSFIDWHGSAFRFGYGTGEEHIIPALKSFLECCPATSCYDHRDLEKLLTPTVAWLLINILCQQNILEYGSSPRFAWLTDEGIALKNFISSKTIDELYEAVMVNENYIHCYQDACNCGDDGYQDGVKCVNPFWHQKYGRI